MKYVLWIALALLVLAGFWLAWSPRALPSSPAVVAGPRDTTAPAPSEPAALSGAFAAAEPAEEPAPGSREIVPAAPPAASAVAPPAAAPRVGRGRLLDCGGVGMAGVKVGYEGAREDEPESQVVSGGGGFFELTERSHATSVVALDPRYETVLAGKIDPDSRTPTLVVVARRIAVAGRVLDADGIPLEGATLRIALRQPLAVSFERTLDSASTRFWDCKSAADGRFAFENAPLLPGAALVASLPGFLPFEMELLPNDVRHLVVVLERPAQTKGLVRGLVLDGEGEPVAGARVSAAPAATKCDERGRFELSLEPEPKEALLVAVKSGLGACSRAIERDPVDQHVLWPDTIVLVIDGSPGSTGGRVVDEHREPIADARVWLVDPTAAGLVEGGPANAEALTRNASACGWSFVTTDEDGHFVLEGLLRRRYRVRALDMQSLLQVEASDVQPGDELELVLPTGSLPHRVAGRVVDSAGRPLAGVELRVTCPTFRGVGENGWAWTDGVMREPEYTDGEGRFELPPFPFETAKLHLDSEEVFPSEADLAAQDDPADMTLIARLRVHVQVELAPPATWADEFELHDEAGEALWLGQLREGRSGIYTRAALVDGRSVVWTVPETARTLVLYSGGREVRREPVALTPGDVNVLRF